MGRYNEVTNLPYTRSKHTPVSHCYIFYSVRFLQWCPGTQDHRWTCVKNTRGTCTDSEETWFNDFFRKIGHSRLQDFAMYEIKRENLTNIVQNICNLRRKWCSTLIETGSSNSKIFFEFEEYSRSSRIYNNEEEEASSLEGSDHLKQGNVFIMNNVCNIARTYPISDRVKKCTLILSLTRTSFEPHSRLIRCIRIHLKVACLDSIFLSISKINNRPMQF